MTVRADGQWSHFPQAELDEAVTRRLIAVTKHSSREIPFYRWFYRDRIDEVRAIRDRADFARTVPFVTKADIVEFQNQQVGPSWSPRSRQLHLTSGTSGKGREWYVREPRDLVALGQPGAVGFARAGIKPGDRILLTIPFSQTMAGPYFQESCRAVGAVPIVSHHVDTKERVQLAGRFGVSAIVATPSHLHRLAAAASEMDVVPTRDLPRLNALVLSGEPFGPRWARDMEEFWGAQVHEGWGSTQTLGVALTTCEAGAVLDGPDGPRPGSLHGMPHRVHVELLDGDRPVEVGERGEAVVTTLRSWGMPSIRFRMGDELERSGTCDCGRSGLTLRSGTISRVDDMLKIRGTNVWPRAVDDVVIRDAIVDYRGRIFTDSSGRECVELAVATSRPDGPWREELERRLRHRVGVSMRMHLVPADAFADNSFKSRRWEDARDVQSD